MPEARIILSEAAVYVAMSPKSNASYMAIEKAIKAVESNVQARVPAHLQDAHYDGHEDLGHGVGYKYAHDFPNHYVDQQYLPDELKDEKFYEPGDLGVEKDLKDYQEKVNNKKIK